MPGSILTPQVTRATVVSQSGHRGGLVGDERAAASGSSPIPAGRCWRVTRNAAATALLGSILVACNGERREVGSPGASSRVDSFRVEMPELARRQRTIRVYLPKGYESTSRSYPVLYLQDGQQLFARGAFGDWQVDETLDSLADAGRFPGIIVVGIESSEQRWNEYGPWTNGHMHDWISPSWARPAEGGGGESYLRFVVNTLKPEIDRRYRTRPGREHTGIGGSSMGGVIALHAGLTRPHVFSKVMAMSTAVWFAEAGGVWLSENRLVAAASGARVPRDVRFYLDVGTNERSREGDPAVVDGEGRPVTYPRAYVEGSRAVADALLASGVPGSNVRHVVDADAVHHEGAWARRFADAVMWLYR